MYRPDDFCFALESDALASLVQQPETHGQLCASIEIQETLLIGGERKIVF